MLRLRAVLPVALLAALIATPAAGAKNNASEKAPGKYEVGIGSRAIAVDPDRTVQGGGVLLGCLRPRRPADRRSPRDRKSRRRPERPRDRRRRRQEHVRDHRYRGAGLVRR